MLSLWDVYITLTTTISGIFFLSYKIGQTIVTVLVSILKNSRSLVQKIATLLAILSEDFGFFLRDIGLHLNYFFTLWRNFSDTIVSIINSTIVAFGNFFWFIGYSTWTITKSIFDGINAVTLGIINIVVSGKQILLMVGDGMWFIVIFIPQSLFSFIILTLDYCKDLYNLLLKGGSICLLDSYNFARKSIKDCYYFIIDVPLESLTGIVIAVCFLYIFLQFYAVLYVYVQNKISLCITCVKRKYSLLKGGVIRYVSSYNRSHQIPKVKNVNLNLVKNTKNELNDFCVICQDQSKCILLLPCKHLCMCIDCTPRLMRYTGRCPICRKRINSTMKVFT